MNYLFQPSSILIGGQLCVAPQGFQGIILAAVLQEDMRHAVTIIHQNPLALAIAFLVHEPNTLVLLQLFLNAVSNYDFEGSLIGDKANSVVFDNSKLKKAVPGFTATVRFDQGVRKAIDFVLSNKEYQVEDKEFDEWCDKVINALENAKKDILA